MYDPAEIQKLDTEIESLQKLLENSIAMHYGEPAKGRAFSTEEHFQMWDAMWCLMKKKRELLSTK